MPLADLGVEYGLIVSSAENLKNKSIQLTLAASGSETSADFLQPILDEFLEQLQQLYFHTSQFCHGPTCRSHYRYQEVWKNTSRMLAASLTLVQEIVAARNNRDAPPHKTGVIMTICDDIKASATVPKSCDEVMIRQSLAASLSLLEDAHDEIEQSLTLNPEEAETLRAEAIQQMSETHGDSEIVWVGSTDALSPDETKIQSQALQLIRVIIVLLKKFLENLCTSDPHQPPGVPSPLPFVEQFVPLADLMSSRTDDLAFALEPPHDPATVTVAVESLHETATVFLRLLLDAPTSPLLQHPNRTQFTIVENLITTCYRSFREEATRVWEHQT
jgi:DNA polymerase III psi subunit